MMIFGAGFGGIPLLVFVGFALTMVMPHEDWILDYRGESTIAQPTAAHVTNTSVNDQDVYDIDVSYTDKRGRPQRASVSTLNPSVVAAGNAKTPLKIEYDPEQPTRARVVGESASAIGMMAFMPLGFAFIGIPMLLVGLVSTLRRRSLYRRGTPAQARVQQVVASASSQNNQRVMIARYSYQSPRGVAHGELKSVSPPKVGSVIWVLFDPQKPSRSIPA